MKQGFPKKLSIKKNGLKKNISAAEAETNKQLVKIEDCDYYTIEELTHSIPYLVPKAAKLVEDIGKAFQDSLYNRGYHSNHKITVTSVLRTEDNVKQFSNIVCILLGTVSQLCGHEDIILYLQVIVNILTQ